MRHKYPCLRHKFKGRVIFDRLSRLMSIATGNPGDVKPVGEGVSELRIDYGPGYRVYFKKEELKVVILLMGGDKRTQAKDIKTALSLAKDI